MLEEYPEQLLQQRANALSSHRRSFKTDKNSAGARFRRISRALAELAGGGVVQGGLLVRISAGLMLCKPNQ